jgi:hypothetical protein
MSNLTAARFKSVRTRNGLYRRSEYEAVIDDSNRAQLCFQFADLVLQGVDLFDGINSLDEDWRMLISDPASEVQYSDAFEGQITELYRTWLETSHKVLGTYDRLKGDYIDQTRINRLQSGVREVEGILAGDAEFFTELWPIRDEAIDQYRNGETSEING